MKNEYKSNGNYPCNGGCPMYTHQDMDVNIPVDVHAYADVGNVVVTCMGSNIIPVPAEAYYGNESVSRYIISQRISIDIPIICGADANVYKEEICYDKPEPYYTTANGNNTYNGNYYNGNRNYNGNYNGTYNNNHNNNHNHNGNCNGHCNGNLLD